MQGLLYALAHMNVGNVVKGVAVLGGPTIAIISFIIMNG